MLPPTQVSLIIPTYNRQEIVFQTLQYITGQSISGFEVIVVDQTIEKDSNLENFKNDIFEYKYLIITETGLPNARNVGAENAKGDILVFIDDDSIPDSNLVQSYMDLFKSADQEIWCFGGKVIEKNTDMFKENESIVGGMITWYGKTLKNFDTEKSGKCEWAPGGNFAVKRSKFLDIGGFDKNFIGNAILEDGDFGYTISEMGGYVMYSPKPIIEHLRIPTGGTRVDNPSKGMYYRAHNTVYFMRKHKIHLRIFPAFLYLNGVAIKDLVFRKHGLTAIVWNWLGFANGLMTKLPS
ncbi:MAG: glycosyltransferase [Candidatus Marinimicrobia bacterium]|nr:glycosyltransferase [Candidatus Neomarinimicrobiota bacterium]